MEYSVQSLGKMAGVSSRTLRYYDEIGLLKPARIHSSGYRMYGDMEVNQLQHILFYRELGLPLDQIKLLMNAPEFDTVRALVQHHQQLLIRRTQLNTLIQNVERTLAAQEGKIAMTDQQKFEGFKTKLVEENEQRYGQEIRSKYGDDVIDQGNARVLSRTMDEQKAVAQLSEQLMVVLKQAYKTGDPSSSEAQHAADLHRQWLSYHWPTYSKEAHAGLANMYVEDERFTAYYDALQPGMTVFLRDAIVIYTS
ncbi:MerR family transcriptional regulator [Paenibacillus shirakamiensis]|nr:MerR family transcriptional regulator [Paenibacillus shirakamiensis]